MKEIEKEMENPQFWKDQEKIKEYHLLRKQIKDIEDLSEEVELIETEQDLMELERKIREKEILLYLNDKYDKNDAILFLQAGAGGKDSQDWAAMLFRAYQKYCEKKGFKIEILDINYGEVGAEGRIGIKSAVLEILGEFAFGFLKKESGVHRLVRISPFSAKGLRHTSFVLVQVLPKLSAKEININPNEIEMETFKSSGAGGQYVNKRMTAVRLRHIPTGIIVTCQTERSLAQNKEKALEMLRAKLYQYFQEKKEKEIDKLKDKNVKIEFGHQIRSYVLHPYKLVKDLRTGVETSKVEEVLDGNLDEFIEAEIKIHD